MLKKALTILLCVLVICSTLAACSGGSTRSASPSAYKSASSSSAAQYAANDMAAESPEYDMTADAAQSPSAAPDTGGGMPSTPIAERKIIKHVYMDTETLAFDDALAAVERQLELVGGYIDSSSVGGGYSLYDVNVAERGYNTRNASYTLRVPSDKLDELRNNLRAVLNVLLESEESTDITQQYFDTSARVESLKIQEERLLEILKTATNLEDIITLERALSEVRYEIENLTTNLRNYDNLVDYSTLQLSITEVVRYSDNPTPAITFGDEIKLAFKDSVQLVENIFRWLVLTVITFAPLGIVVGVVVLICIVFVRLISKKAKPKTPPVLPPIQPHEQPSKPNDERK